jgi:hypothetical protein
MDSLFGPHTIDRFASVLNTLLPRYNAKWLDPSCEAVDGLCVLSIHLSNAHRRDKTTRATPLAYATRPCSKTAPKRRSSHNGHPPMVRKARRKAFTELACYDTVLLHALTCPVPGGGTDAVQ